MRLAALFVVLFKTGLRLFEVFLGLGSSLIVHGNVSRTRTQRATTQVAQLDASNLALPAGS